MSPTAERQTYFGNTITLSHHGYESVIKPKEGQDLGFKKIISVMTGVFVVFMLLQFVILRNTNNILFKNVTAYAFILIIAALFILLYLNRHRP